MFKIVPHKSAFKSVLILASAVLVALAGVFIYGYLNSHSAEAAWFNDSWGYRTPINITNGSGGALTDFQVSFTLNTTDTSKFQADCDDIRITDTSGEQLPYWIQTDPGCNNASTVIWTKVPSIPSSGGSIYVYYGNPAATIQSNGEDVFLLFDDFNDNSLDPTWTADVQAGLGGTLAETNQELQIYQSQNYYGHIQKTWNTDNVYVQAKIKISGANSGDSWAPGINLWWNDTSNGNNIQFLNNHYRLNWMGVEVANGTGSWTGGSGTGDTNYRYYRLRLSASNINDDMSTDGIAWTNYRSVARAANYSGAPQLIAFGKGYHGTGVAAGAEFNNGVSGGGLAYNYIDDVFVAKNTATLPTTSSGTEEKSQGPIAYWAFDEGFGQTAQDSTVNNLDGTFGVNTGASTDDPAWTTESSCKTGKCLTFDGGDYIKITDNAILEPQNLTVSAWVKTSQSGTNFVGIIDKYIGGTYGYFLDFPSGTNMYPRFSFHNTTSPDTSDNDQTVTATKATNDNVWHHLVATYDGSTCKIYIDGTLNNSASCSGTIDYDTHDVIIGGDGASTNRLNGSIDDIKIYHYARTAAQIKADYNSRGSIKGASVNLGTATIDGNAPVGYWNFDEGVDNTCSATADVCDRSTNNNHGTWNGTGSHWTPGKYGKAGNFNGTDDSTNNSNIPNLFSTVNGTVELWVYSKRTTSQDSESDLIFSARTSPNADRIYLEFLNNGNFGIGFSDSYAIDTGDVLPAGRWNHLALRWSTSTSVTAYLNGTEVYSATRTALSDSPTFITIGGYLSNQYLFTGKIDDVKVYNYARTQKQIVEDMNAGHPAVGSTTPVGYWDFDEGYGDTANNLGSGGSTLNGNLAGACPGAATCPTRTHAGKFGEALNFDGGDYISIADNSSLDITGAFTYSVWVKYSANGTTNERIISKGQSGASYGCMMFKTNGAKTISFGDSGGFISTTNSFGDNNWHHIVSIHDGTNTSSGLSFYVDGIKQATTTVASFNGCSATNEPLVIGADSDDSSITSYFNGLLDQVKIYNYGLTADEIKAEYNQGQAIVLGALGTNSSYSSNASNQEYCVPGDTSSCTAPAAEWTFDEATDNTCSATADVCDRSGNGYHGTWNGTGSHWTSGKIGKAGNFKAATTDYVSIGDILDSSSIMTFSAWYKPSVTGTNNAILFKRIGATEYAQYALATTGGLLYCLQSSSGTTWETVISATEPSANVWHHIACTNDNTTARLYIDGVQVGTDSSPATSLAASTESFNIGFGRVATADNYLTGQVDDVKIYNYSRSPAQIAWDYNKGKPIAHWDFDECQGNTLNDLSGNNNPATITIGASGENTLGTCTTSSSAWGDGASGKINYSLKLDGNDDFAEKSYNSLFTPGSQNWSVAAWVKAASGSTNRFIVSWYRCGANPSCLSPDNARYDLYINTNNLASWVVRDDNFNDDTLVSVNSVADNTWHFIVGTYTSNSRKLYVDGIEVDNSSTPVTTLSSAAVSIPLEIGRAYVTGWGSPHSYFSGQIDDVKIFNYALSSTQVKTLFNNGAVNFGPSSGSP